MAIIVYVVYQTRKTVDDHISKHRVESCNYDPQLSTLDEIEGVWNSSQTLSSVSALPLFQTT